MTDPLLALMDRTLRDPEKRARLQELGVELTGEIARVTDPAAPPMMADALVTEGYCPICHRLAGDNGKENGDAVCIHKLAVAKECAA